MYSVEFEWMPYFGNKPEKLKLAIDWCEANCSPGSVHCAFLPYDDDHGGGPTAYVITFDNEEDLVEFKLSCL